MADRCVRHRQSLELIGRTLWNQQNIRLQGPTHGKNLLSGSDWQHKNVLACRSFFPKMFDGREAERLGWLGSVADQAFMSPWYDIRCASHLYGCVMSASFYHQSLPLDPANRRFSVITWSAPTECITWTKKPDCQSSITTHSHFFGLICP